LDSFSVSKVVATTIIEISGAYKTLQRYWIRIELSSFLVEREC